MLRKGSLYVNDIMLGTKPINRIFNKEEIYWGNNDTSHIIWGKLLDPSVAPVFIFNARLDQKVVSHVNEHNNTFYVDESDLVNITMPITKLLGFAAGSENYNIVSLNVKIDTYNVTDGYQIFYALPNVEYINMSGMDLRNATRINQLCQQCSNLRIINMTKCLISPDTRHIDIFKLCRSLTDVYITEEMTLMSLTNNLTSSDPNYYIPSTATIHYNDINYKWIDNAWQIV